MNTQAPSSSSCLCSFLAPSNSAFHFFKFYMLFNQAHLLLFFTLDNDFLLHEFSTSDLKVSWTFLDTILTSPQHHKFSSFFNSQFLEDLFPFRFISGFFFFCCNFKVDCCFLCCKFWRFSIPLQSWSILVILQLGLFAYSNFVATKSTSVALFFSIFFVHLPSTSISFFLKIQV